MKKIKILILLLTSLLMMFCFISCGKESGDKLECPTGFVLDETYTVNWLTVDNAKKYELEINEINTGATITETTVRESFSFGVDSIPEGDYDVRVRALGDGKSYRNSEWSSFFSLSKSAEIGCIFTLINNGSEYILSSASASVSDLELYDSYRGKPITVIGDSAFRKASRLKSIKIGKFVSEISDYAFYNCIELEKIEIPETVTYIGVATFQSCAKLTSLLVPTGITEISESCFAYCRGLESVDFNSVKIIGESAFDNCSNIKAIEFSKNVVSIGNFAFRKCSALESVILEENVVSIGEQAFIDCENLSVLTFSEQSSLKSIGTSAFARCNLSDLVFPIGLQYIGGTAFFENQNMQTVDLPDSLTELGGRVFYGTKLYKDAVESGDVFVYADKWLAEVIYDSSKPIVQVVNTTADEDNGKYKMRSDTIGIADYAFAGFPELTDLFLENSVQYIGMFAFSGCPKLWRFSALGTNLKEIGPAAFSKCEKLQKPFLSNSDSSLDKLEIIGDYAFSGCVSLDYNGASAATRFIPTTVKRIGVNAFEGTMLYDHPDEYGVIYADDWVVGCTGSYIDSANGPMPPEEKTFSQIALKSDTRGIGDYAFYNCIDIESLTNSNSVLYIGVGAFYNCKSLLSYTFNQNITTISDYAFYGASSLMVDRLPRRLKTIGRSAFYNCLKLNEIELPSTLENLGDYSFYGCSNLETVKLNTSINKIGDYAFYGCEKIKSITIPSNVKAIGNSAFSGCIGLTELTIEKEGVEEIGSFAFYNNECLSYVDLPESVKVVGKYAFNGCSSATSIYLAGVEIIEPFAFGNMTKVKMMSIPATVKTVGIGAFLYLGSEAYAESYIEIDEDSGEEREVIAYSGITSVIIKGDIPKIDAHTFYGCNYVTFYIECQNKNAEWGTAWNSPHRSVIWGVALSENKDYVESVEVNNGTFENLNAMFGVNAPYREGYGFVGWSISQDGKEIAYSASQLASVPIGTTIYAVYEEIKIDTSFDE